ncbi:unnamed protein product [Ilex paraguariensis]|uniref:DOG1 domain-containing protein n=1 Tax=Ilex paraguariensis TaxID=185542 RepID=A0ABC8RT32_9AQUA
MESGDSSGDSNRQHCCFREWQTQQEEYLSELLRELQLSGDGHDKDTLLRNLAEKNIKHFQEYIDKRNRLARADISPFFAPDWCTSLESSLLWIAGCRPSSFIRLIYAICGSQIESQLTQFLQGVRTGNLGELNAAQLNLVNRLQGKVIREEEKLTSQMASLQEEIADHPISVIANGAVRNGGDGGNTEVEEALDEHSRSMLRVMEEADQLRMSTLKELIGILTPVQAVDFLTASRKLHLSIHEWGLKRDHLHGRN